LTIAGDPWYIGFTIERTLGTDGFVELTTWTGDF